MAYCERQLEQGQKEFIIGIIYGEKEWLKTVLKQTSLSWEQASKMLGVWTTIADIDWGDRWKVPHIYINGGGMKKFGFPEGSEGCKVIHEETEAKLCLGGASRQEAHQKAVEAEFRKAKKLGILDPYAIAEIKSSLMGNLVKNAAKKAAVYFRIKREDSTAA